MLTRALVVKPVLKRLDRLCSAVERVAQALERAYPAPPDEVPGDIDVLYTDEVVDLAREIAAIHGAKVGKDEQDV